MLKRAGKDALVTAPGADAGAIERAARTVVGAEGVVLGGESRSAAEPLDDVETRWFGDQLLSGMAVLVAFTAVFIVAATFALGVAQRRGEQGLLRTVGATPRRLRALMHGEALVVGVAAAAAGAAVGTVCAPAFGQTLLDLGFEPASFAVRIELWPPAASFAAGLAVAQLGVWAVSRRAAKVAPLEALREAVVEERPMTAGRWAFGALFTVAGVVLGGVGAAVPVTFEDGREASLRVVAVLRDSPAEILLTRRAVREHDPSALTEPVYLTAPATLPAYAGAAVEKIAERMAGIEEHDDHLVWVFVLVLVACPWATARSPSPTRC